MGLFTPYIYTNKQRKKFWLHCKQRGKVTLYYFSCDPIGSLNSLPNGYEVIENPLTGLPFLKKKIGKGFMDNFFGKLDIKKKEEKKETEKTE